MDTTYSLPEVVLTCECIKASGTWYGSDQKRLCAVFDGYIAFYTLDGDERRKIPRENIRDSRYANNVLTIYLTPKENRRDIVLTFAEGTRDEDKSENYRTQRLIEFFRGQISMCGDI
jgi:hypothetical protein